MFAAKVMVERCWSGRSRISIERDQMVVSGRWESRRGWEREQKSWKRRSSLFSQERRVEQRGWGR